MRVAGFTLLELLCSLAVAGIVLGLGVPTFQTFALDSRRTADINAFVLAIQLARSEAGKRGRTVVVCNSPDLVRCGEPGTSYASGWIVFVNEDGVRPPNRSAGEPLLYAHLPEIAGSITSNRELYEFRPFRKRSTNGTVTFCDRRGALAARAVIVSYTGRPRVSSRDAGNRPLACVPSS